MTATYKEIKVVSIKKEIDECLCNKCARALRKNPNAGLYGLIEHTYSGHYGSNPLNDLTDYTFSLCEFCLADMFLEFKLPPKILDRLNRDHLDPEITWEEESSYIKNNIIKNVI